MPVAQTAQASAAPAVPADAVQPSLAEQLSAFGRGAWTHLAQLNAREASLNLLMSAAIVVMALALVWLLRRLFDHWLGQFVESCGGNDEESKRAPKAVGVTWVLLRMAVLVAALLFAAQVWGIDPWALVTGQAAARIVRVALILVLATAVFEVAGFVIRRLVESFARRSGDGRRAGQIRTLGPLLTGSVQGVIFVIGLLTLLSEIGVKVGPLMASAGVVGIAVGFGAQTIVKDFLTGLFLIAEDVVSVGDNVRIGDASGTVEAMTLRTIRLRNTNGTLHIFPYSEAQVIHNRTKVFSSYVFEMVVSYDTDVDRALDVMEAVGKSLQDDPEYGSLITKPFELLGVDKLGESGVTLKGKITTRPTSQWKVGREYNRRIKNAFSSEGVSSPYTSIQIMPPAADDEGEVSDAAPDHVASERRSFDGSDERHSR